MTHRETEFASCRTVERRDCAMLNAHEEHLWEWDGSKVLCFGVHEEPCPRCGGDAGDNHFDRSLCACGSMHTCCNKCGTPLDGCEYIELEGTLADGLD